MATGPTRAIVNTAMPTGADVVTVTAATVLVMMDGAIGSVDMTAAITTTADAGTTSTTGTKPSLHEGLRQRGPLHCRQINKKGLPVGEPL